MPRRKKLPEPAPERIPHTIRKTYKTGRSALFVRVAIPWLKSPVWRKLDDETPDGAARLIEQVKIEESRKVKESEIPTRCDKFFAFWQNLIKPRVTERTARGYEKMIRLYIQPAFGFFELPEVRPVMLSMMYQKMLEDGLQTRTVRAAHTLASMVFKEAVNLELIASNPVQRVRPPKLKKSDKVKVMNLSEVRDFFAAAENSPHKFVFEFALETGMRPQEYLALKWSHIDFKKGAVRVERALVYDQRGGGFYFKETKTEQSKRIIPLSPELIEKLLAHRAAQKRFLAELEEKIRRREKPSREYRKIIRRAVIDNYQTLNLVFPSVDGTPMQELNLNKRYFKKIAADAGLPGSLSLYSLRHTCATLLMSAGVNPKIVSERLGHSGIMITLETYSHVLPGMQETATETMSDLLYS